MPVVEREDGLGAEEATTENQTGTKPARRFLSRTAAAGRQKQEASLATAIRAMELDLDPENVSVHEVLLHQMLENLEREHNMYVVTENLDINIEHEISYMLEFEGKVSRALQRQRTRLQIPPVISQPSQPRCLQTENIAFRLMEDELADRMT